jgi:hypothetical protein
VEHLDLSGQRVGLVREDRRNNFAAGTSKKGMRTQMPSILDGTHDLIDDWLDLHFEAQRPLYRHREAWIVCSTMDPVDGCVFVRSFLCFVDKNCRDRLRTKPASVQKWRFKQFPNCASKNTSSEMILERKLVDGALDSLANQIPVASGVCSQYERKRAIDLAKRCGPSEYTFFELKVNTNTPLFAAMELLGYAACYVAARRNMVLLGYPADQKPLLAATVIHLRVLAPLAYYGDGGNPRSLLWLQTAINSGLQCVNKFVEGLQMDFEFEAFPADFTLNSDPATLRDCLCRRVPAYLSAVP